MKTKIPFFRRFVISNFPFIESDFDALNDYQLMSKIVEYLNKVIAQTNKDSEAIQQLQQYVEHYFDNLDVQSEINNKLEDMAQSGELSDIIAQYIQLAGVLAYDSVADMQSAENLVNGSFCKTYGFNEKGDGGSALYKIRNVENDDVVDGMNLIQITSDPTNQLVAEFIRMGEVYPEQFGAYGDGVHDDTDAFENIINKYNVMHLYKKVYKIDGFTVSKDFTIYGNDATLIDNGTTEQFIKMDTSSTNKLLKIFNLQVNTPDSEVAIYINGNRLYAQYLTVRYASVADIQIIKTGSAGSCELNNIKCQLSPIGIDINASDCKITRYEGYNCLTHFKLDGGLNHLNEIQGWNYNDGETDYVTGSSLIDTSSSLIGCDIYADTVENAIKLPNGKSNMSIVLQNFIYAINQSSYPLTQQAPTLLANLSNYAGNCKIDGLYAYAGGWVDGSNNEPVLVDNVNPSRYSFTNVSEVGFRFNNYQPIEVNTDISASSYTINEGTYLEPYVAKLKLKEYNINAYMGFTFKTSCPTDTNILEVTFSGQRLNNLNLRSRVLAKYIQTGTGVQFELPCYINSSHKLIIRNNTGSTLTGSDGGSVQVYIDDFNMNY